MNSSTVLVIITALFLTSLLYSILKNLLMNPLFVFITPLFAQYWIYQLVYASSHSLDSKTNFLFIFSIISFTFGYIWMMFFPNLKSMRTKQEIVTTSYYHFFKVKNAFIIIGITGFAYGCFLSFQYGISGPGNFFFNLRYANTVEGLGLSIAPYFLLFLHVILLYYACNLSKNKRIFVLLLLIMLSSALFTMARTSLMLTIVSTMAAYLLSNKYIHHGKNTVNVKVLVISIFSFISLSWVVAYFTNKLNSAYGNFVFTYIGYPLVAFDERILQLDATTNGSQTFTLFYKIFSVLGLAKQPEGYDLGLTGRDFNVFTFMREPYMDFGEIGLYAVSLILGIIYGFIYRQVRKGNIYWIIFYSIMLYPLVMSFYAFQYNLTSLVYYAIILFFVYARRKLFMTSSKQYERI